jgi:hypothetical protein
MRKPACATLRSSPHPQLLKRKNVVIRILSGLKSVAGFLFRYPKDAAIILLSLLLIFMNWRLKVEQRKPQELGAKVTSLPAGTKEVVTIYLDRVITKWRDGPTKIEYRDQYLPPEGHVEVITKTDHPNASPGVKIKDRGFTFRLGGGTVYSGRFLPEGDVKLVYWKQYGFLIGVTPDFGGVGLSRHVDDFLPIHNLEVQGNAGVSWQGNLRLAVGLRTNF